MKHRHILVLGAILGLAVAGMARAESTDEEDEFHPPGIYLTTSDKQQIRELGKKLYRTDKATTGATEIWRNPKTGHQGSISVLRVYTKGAEPCRTVRYDTSFDETNSTSYVVDWCREADGEWKIQ